MIAAPTKVPTAPPRPPESEVLNNGMNLLDVSAFYQQIVKGGVILAALLIDRLVASR